MALRNGHSEPRRTGSTTVTSKALSLAMNHVDAPIRSDPKSGALSIDQLRLEGISTAGICLVAIFGDDTAA